MPYLLEERDLVSDPFPPTKRRQMIVDADSGSHAICMAMKRQSSDQERVFASGQAEKGGKGIQTEAQVLGSRDQSQALNKSRSLFIRPRISLSLIRLLHAILLLLLSWSANCAYDQ